jgi:hypothetical protein
MTTTTKLHSTLALALLAAGCGKEETATTSSVQTGALTSAPALGNVQSSGISGANAAETPPVVLATFNTYACLAEQSQVSAYSGRSGNGTNILSRAASDNDAITGVSMQEDADDPCWMQLAYEDVETGAAGATRTYDRCDGSEGDFTTTNLPSGSFTIGVRVCLNSSRDKLKGIQLIGQYAACMRGAAHVYLDPAPCSEVFHAGGMEYRVCDADQPSFIEIDCPAAGIASAAIERANCDGENEGPDEDWEPAVYCPPGMVATGFHLNVISGGGFSQMYNGVALECDDLIAE